MLRAEREAQSLGIIMLDVDHFKSVNDTHGHRGGDAVLCSLVQQVEAILRPYDSLGRFGGEEFLTVVPGCGLTQVKKLSERIRSHIAENPIPVDDTVVSVTVSIGVAIHVLGYNSESLLHTADTALYLAKKTGRNRVGLPVETESFVEFSDTVVLFPVGGNETV